MAHMGQWPLLVIVGVLISFAGFFVYAMWEQEQINEHIEGEVIDKYVDTHNDDTFVLIIRTNTNEIWRARINVHDYYNYEVGDWFDGEVYHANNLDSGWS